VERRRVLVLVSALIVRAGAGLRARSAPQTQKDVNDIRQNWRALLSAGADMPLPSDRVNRSKNEWRALLSKEQYAVLRDQVTERPGSSPLDGEHRAGVFVCAGCGLPLFTSLMKYDSGTGWPSFFTSIPGHLDTRADFLLAESRTEYPASDVTAIKDMCSTTGRGQPENAGATTA